MRESRRRQVGEFFVFNVALALITTFVGVLTARVLGPEQRGVLGGIFTWTVLWVGIAGMSVNEALAYLLRDIPKQRQALVSAATSLALAWGMFAGVACAGVYLAAHMIVKPQGWDNASLFALVFVPITTLGTVTLYVFMGMKDFIRVNILRLVGPTVLLVALGTSAAQGLPAQVETLLALYVVAELAALSSIVLSVHMQVGWSGFSVEHIRRLLQTGVRFHQTHVLATACAFADKLLIIVLASPAQVGFYLVAISIAVTGMNAVGSAFFSVATPSLIGLPEKERLTLTQKTIGAALVVLSGVAVIGAGLSFPLVPLLFGEAFAPASGICALGFLGAAFQSMRQVAYRCLRAWNEVATGTISEGIYLGTLLPVGGLLTYQFGAWGTITAFTLCNVLSLLVTFARLVKISTQSWSAYLASTYRHTATAMLRRR